MMKRLARHLMLLAFISIIFAQMVYSYPPFQPGTNKTIEWISAKDFQSMASSIAKPIIIYGYTMNDENFSCAFELGIFAQETVYSLSKSFICTMVNLDKSTDVNILSSSLNGLAGKPIKLPTTTFVLMLTRNGTEVYNLSKGMAPETFLTYMHSTINIDSKEFVKK